MATDLYSQADFSGGMNLLDPDIALQPNEYGLATNLRNRQGALEAINGAIEDEDAPSGNKQGIFAYEDFVLVFNNGNAYFKNIVTDGPWTQVVDFNLLPSVDYIYAEVVPVSTFNFERRLQESNRIDGSSTETNVNTTAIKINGTAAGLVCQDGESQPYLINSVGIGRKTQKYSEWVTSNREYVPVMRQMKYHGGILYGVAKDGIRLLRSVTGRPLDFVVNITVNGEKGDDAFSTAYSVGTNQITCLSSLKTGELFVGTKYSCHPVDINYDKTIFGEPTFRNNKAFAAGIVNQHSFLDIRTDYTMIDEDGIRSWNAIFIQDNEGRNSNFSLKISKVLAGILQDATTTASIVFDNYSIYAINTIYGNRLAIYDNIRQQWVALDNLGIGAIKQFAIARQSGSPTLYAITATKVYKLYTGTTAQASVRFRALNSGNSGIGVKVEGAFVTFDRPTVDDTVSMKEIYNNQDGEIITGQVTGDGNVDTIPFNFLQCGKEAKKIQHELTWQNDAQITEYTANVTSAKRDVSIRQGGKLYEDS